MPIYDYLCSSCGERTEVIHGIDAPGPRFCPACGAEDTLRKAFAPPAVHFKGSGWAKKDRSSAKSKATTKSDSSAEPAAKSASGDGTGGSGSSDSSSKAASGSTSSGSTTSGASGGSASSGPAEG